MPICMCACKFLLNVLSLLGYQILVSSQFCNYFFDTRKASAYRYGLVRNISMVNNTNLVILPCMLGNWNVHLKIVYILFCYIQHNRYDHVLFAGLLPIIPFNTRIIPPSSNNGSFTDCNLMSGLYHCNSHQLLIQLQCWHQPVLCMEFTRVNIHCRLPKFTSTSESVYHILCT